MDYKRNLNKGTSCVDVLLCKQKLLELGFYGNHITTISRKTFGADTLEAVKRFQEQAGFTLDKVAGKQTWATLCSDTATVAKPITRARVSDKTKQNYDQEERLSGAPFFDTRRMEYGEIQNDPAGI